MQYARSGELSIAYQVVGEGPIDLVYVPLNLSIAICWEQPLVASFFKRLASFSRLILLDKRGTGMSDRPRTLPTLEAQMDDVRAVLDAVGVEQAALFGGLHGVQMCALFAATYPERSSALILYNALTRYPGGEDERRAFLRRVRNSWGTREWVELVARTNYPSYCDDPSFVRWLTKAVRVGLTPASAVEFLRTVTEADITDVLPAIRVPTLVLYRRDVAAEAFLGADVREEAQLIADAVPDARVVAVPGRDNAPYVGDEVPEEVERFLRAPAAPTLPDRVLATVLFTDIVGSTERASALGDSAWRELLASHRSQVRRELGRFRGVELDTAGDGFFASFDGPARAIACAQAIVDSSSEQGIDIRAGLHTGECEREGEKLAGIAVHTGARIAALARPGEILVSRTVKDLVAGSEIKFDDRGDHELKGITGEWRLYAVRQLPEGAPSH